MLYYRVYTWCWYVWRVKIHGDAPPPLQCVRIIVLHTPIFIYSIGPSRTDRTKRYTIIIIYYHCHHDIKLLSHVCAQVGSDSQTAAEGRVVSRVLHHARMELQEHERAETIHRARPQRPEDVLL